MEPIDPSKWQVTMDSFYKTTFERKGKITGSILMGVDCVWISEGLNFSDNLARCVIVVGIPHPQITDPRVILKQDYLNKKCLKDNSQGFQALSGKDWYS